MSPRYWTPTQIAEELQVNVRTVYLWIQQGKINSVRMGRLVRVSDEDFNAFLEALPKGQTPEEGDAEK